MAFSPAIFNRYFEGEELAEQAYKAGEITPAELDSYGTCSQADRVTKLLIRTLGEYPT